MGAESPGTAINRSPIELALGRVGSNTAACRRYLWLSRRL
jgi:hypothetical protein